MNDKGIYMYAFVIIEEKTDYMAVYVGLINQCQTNVNNYKFYVCFFNMRNYSL